jgi:Family of unknown function (DUF5565)
MKKIPTVFERDWNGEPSMVVDKVTEGCEWVLAGEGIATRKFDGSCCLIRDGKLYKRREIRAGQVPPLNFEQVDADLTTGKRVGWVPVGDGPEDRWHRNAFLDDPAFRPGERPDGTYELLGPKINGNPERSETHFLVRHGAIEVVVHERTFENIRLFLTALDMEGIVFHHPDGRMAKIKGRDFGLKRARGEPS